jgi:DNA invertase Pin-like site-specific DNA recombinase
VEEGRGTEATQTLQIACDSEPDPHEAQLRDLREYVAARGWQATEYLDQGVSGAKDRRPGLDRLLAVVKARKVDVVVVAAFDRFGRSVRHLVECLELCRHYGVEFVSLREQIDTGSPLGHAVFTIIAAIAQLERSLIAERVRAGLRRAKADGKRLGRPRVEVDRARFQSVIRRGLSVREGAGTRNLCLVVRAARAVRLSESERINEPGRCVTDSGVKHAPLHDRRACRTLPRATVGCQRQGTSPGRWAVPAIEA